jgi:hypothetical protein
MWEPRHLKTLWASKARYGDNFTFLPLQKPSSGLYPEPDESSLYIHSSYSKSIMRSTFSSTSTPTFFILKKWKSAYEITLSVCLFFQCIPYRYTDGLYLIKYLIGTMWSNKCGRVVHPGNSCPPGIPTKHLYAFFPSVTCVLCSLAIISFWLD